MRVKRVMNRMSLVLLICLSCSCSSDVDINSSWITEEVRIDGLQQRFFKSKVHGVNVSYHIYTPKSYDNKGQPLPVIYWLHGHNSPTKGITSMVKYFSKAMQNAKIPPTIIVFPNGMNESMWSNSKNGLVPMETVVIRELIPDVDANFHTIKSRRGRLIEGFSMGGYGAARLGMKYPEVFGAISILGAGPMQLDFSAVSGPKELEESRIRVIKNVFGNDSSYSKEISPWRLAEKYSHTIDEKSLIRIAIGGSDATLRPNQEFSSHLTHLGIPHSFHVIPGIKHSVLPLLMEMGEENWNFYRSAFGLKPLMNKGVESRQLDRGKALQKNRGRQLFIKRLRRFDFDRNGTVNLSDVPVRALKNARRLDLNHDGVVDAGEMR